MYNTARGPICSFLLSYIGECKMKRVLLGAQSMRPFAQSPLPKHTHHCHEPLAKRSLHRLIHILVRGTVVELTELFLLICSIFERKCALSRRYSKKRSLKVRRILTIKTHQQIKFGMVKENPKISTVVPISGCKRRQLISKIAKLHIVT